MVGEPRALMGFSGISSSHVLFRSDEHIGTQPESDNIAEPLNLRKFQETHAMHGTDALEFVSEGTPRSEKSYG